MTDQTTVESSGTVPMPNIINTGATPHESGGGIKPADLAKPEVPSRPESVRDTLESIRKDQSAKAEGAEKAVVKDEPAPAKVEGEKGKAEQAKKADAEPADAKAAETAKESAKAEKGEAAKPATGRDGDEGRQSEGRKHSDPPARFLPEARTKWANVPNEVKAEVHRVAQEYEAELSQAREARERYEPIRRFDDMARANGGDLQQTLDRVVQIESAMARNPIAALDMILRDAGPRKPDGSPMSLAEVAHFVAQQSPQQMQAIMAQGQPAAAQQRQPDPEVAALRQELQQVQSQMASATLTPMVQQFADAHPDYHTLEPQIAEVLKSGVVERLFGAGLSPLQRLSEAYRIAGGSPSQSDARDHPVPPPASPAPLDAGAKSVRGAPNGGDDTVFERPAKSTRDLLREEMRKLGS